MKPGLIILAQLICGGIGVYGLTISRRSSPTYTISSVLVVAKDARPTIKPPLASSTKRESYTAATQVQYKSTKVKRTGEVLTDEERQTFFDDIKLPRARDIVIAAGERARMALDQPRPRDHRDKSIPNFPVTEGHGYDIRIFEFEDDSKPMTKPENAVLILYEEVMLKPPAEDYFTFRIANVPADLNEAIVEGRYSEKDGNLVIKKMFKEEDDNAKRGDAEIGFSDLIAGAIYSIVDAQDRDKLRINTLTQEDIIGLETTEIITDVVGWVKQSPLKKWKPQYLKDGIISYMFKRSDKEGKEEEFFNALIGSRNVRWLEGMFADHRDRFDGLKIEAITVQKFDPYVTVKAEDSDNINSRSGGHIDVEYNMIIHMEKFETAEEEEEETDEK